MAPRPLVRALVNPHSNTNKMSTMIGGCEGRVAETPTASRSQGRKPREASHVLESLGAAMGSIADRKAIESSVPHSSSSSFHHRDDDDGSGHRLAQHGVAIRAALPIRQTRSSSRDPMRGCDPIEEATPVEKHTLS